MVCSADLSTGLLVRPQPFRGEGLKGLFLRLADVNALLPDVDLYRTTFGGIGLNGVTRARLEDAARTLGLDIDSLKGLGCRAMVSDPTRCHYLGHRIAAQHLRGAQCAVCPRCLVACAAMRADWELVAQVVCPEHGCWLIDRCSRCRHPISWRRKGVQICLCGQHLGQLSTMPADPCALEYGRVVARRLFGDLEPVDGPSWIPEVVAAAPLNQLLGLFKLFHNSRFRALEGDPPNLRNWSTRVRGQVATVLAIGSVLTDWPRKWHEVLGRVADPAPYSSSQRRRIVSVEEARAPFAVLHRMRWSAAAEFPPVFREELAAFLSERKVRVGSRRYYTIGARMKAKAASPDELKHLWSSARREESVSMDDLFSLDAVRDLFDASEAQMRALQRMGVLPNRQWFSSRDVDASFERLTHWTTSRPRAASDDDFIPLGDVGVTASPDLEAALRCVLAGEVPTVTWKHLRPPGLGNLFVRTRKSADPVGRRPDALVSKS